MKHIFRSFIIVLFFCHSASVLSAQPALQAISGTVSGKVQQVGFRALIFKQAIQYNLAGTAQNLQNETVQFVLQGNSERIAEALAAVRKGSGKSSDVNVTTSPAVVDANLKTFRVIGWTSTSREIATPYDLIFTQRPDDSVVSEPESRKIYNTILKNTLNPAKKN